MEITKHKTRDDQDLLQLVSFQIGSEEFGIDILMVQEIIRLIEITKIPNSPSYIEGIVNLRGKVISIIDLRVKLGIEKISPTNETRIIVVDIDSMIVGFLVDSVSEVLRIPKSITEAPPSIVNGLDTEYITAVGKLEDRLLILLDLKKVLLKDENKDTELALLKKSLETLFTPL
jgi:purine-binding chemotaxis protein CheW